MPSCSFPRRATDTLHDDPMLARHWMAHVDNVITASCQLAKLRGSSSLELRDIQVILERNYNIRVPGFASDELRTVRKIQPTQGWSQKMSAVQASKVTGGKGDL